MSPGRLVLCSDGLWNHVATTRELAAAVAELAGPAGDRASARALTDRALGRGGHDNITVAVDRHRAAPVPDRRRGEPT